jgi:aminoacrylate hydrolase
MPFAELADAAIHYKVRGEGFPVLGIMGFGLDQRFWAGQIPVVTEHHRFITFDNRGTGTSTGAPAGRLEDLAGDALGVLDRLEVERAIVMGVSMGGAIAQHVALTAPDRVAALVLGMTWARPIEFMRRQHELGRIIIKGAGSQGLIESSIVRMFTPRFFEIGREAIDRMLLSMSADGAPMLASEDVLLAQLDALDMHNTIDRLGEIRCPTLVIGGEMDVLVPYFASEEIAGAIPGAQLVTLHTGHALMIEEMDAFNRALTAFLDSLALG